MRAAARLAQKGIRFQLRLVGDGPSRGQIEAEIAKLNLTDRVQIAGWLDGAGVQNEVLSARAMVLPSFAEGLPVVLMEALALGRPVITTAIAGIPELVQDHVSGWLVPAGDVESLAAAMEEALGMSPDRLGEMGGAGRARVLAMHDGTEEARKLEALFRASVERRRPQVAHAEESDVTLAPAVPWRDNEPAAVPAGDSRCAG